ARGADHRREDTDRCPRRPLALREGARPPVVRLRARFLRGGRPGGGRGHPGGPLRSRGRRYQAVAGAGSGAIDAGTAADPRDLHRRGGDRAAWSGSAPGQRLQGGAGETHRRARPDALRRSTVMSDEIGKPYPRRDGRAKVTGEAVYSYEWPVPGILYGVLVTSNLAKGRITSIESAAAEKEPGVIAVLTPFNTMKLPGGAKPADTGDRVVQVLQDDQILYSNQPVAVAIADTFERALHAAAQVRVSAQALPFTVRMADELHAAFPHDIRTSAGSQPADQLRGDVEAALRRAEHKVEADYETPPETHNPLEPHA